MAPVDESVTAVGVDVSVLLEEKKKLLELLENATKVLKCITVRVYYSR